MTEPGPDWQPPEPLALLPFDLPPGVAVLRARLRRHIELDLLPIEHERGLTEVGQVDAALRRAIRQRSAQLGFFRLAAPAVEGGGGLGAIALTAVREEIARSGSLLARFLLGTSIGALRHARGPQREQYLVPVLQGEKSFAFAFTEPREPEARTTATRSASGYRLNGVKSFVSDGVFVDFLIVLARVQQPNGEDAPALFLVDRESPGLELIELLETMDGSGHGVFRFRDVDVPPEGLLGAVGEGMPRALENIDEMRLALAAQAAGTAWRVLELTLRHTRQPHRSGTPLAEREQVQAMLGEMAADTVAARVLTYSVAGALEAGRVVGAETALAKMTATEAAGRVVDRAIQLFGGAAYVHGHPLERLYRVVRGWRLAEGTSEILRLSVARELLRRIDCSESASASRDS